MIIQHFILLFLFLIVSIAICFASEPVPTAGPFITKMVSAMDCSNTSKPYLKNSPIVFVPTIQNIDGKNIFGGNVTITKDVKDARLKIKSYLWRNGQWHLSHMFNNLNCRGLLLRLTFKATQIKFDKNNCLFFKGVYIFENIDVNLIQHIWVSSMPYGRVMWRAEAYCNSGTFFCKEFDTNTEPAYFG